MKEQTKQVSLTRRKEKEIRILKIQFFVLPIQKWVRKAICRKGRELVRLEADAFVGSVDRDPRVVTLKTYRV